MIVLGVGGLMHDYNCCLIDVERQRLTMREAERESREKHHTLKKIEEIMAPIAACCRDLGVNPEAIDVIAFAHTDDFPAKAWFRQQFPGAKFIDIDHHLTHAAGAFFSSPFDSAAIVSLDGFGDGSSGLLAVGRGNRIEELERISEENSIGLEYLRATYHIGLGGYGSEGKTQGLAPYGQPTIFESYLQEIEVLASGNLKLSDKLRYKHSQLVEEGGYVQTEHLSNPFLEAYSVPRLNPEPFTDIYKNLAASIQKVLEHVALEICRIMRQRTGETKLVLSGGVAMNSSMNGEILRSGIFEQVSALPMASDRGTALGAALYYVHQIENVPRFYHLDTAYYGGTYQDAEAEQAMQAAGLQVSRPADICAVAAEALARSEIIGWFQGRSELGARALGNRSILADPRRAEMKDIVNARVKHREWFRPFAPAVLEERAPEYFSYRPEAADLTYMTFTVPTVPTAASAIPATVHVDGSARVQTVAPARNPMYARVIQLFAEQTGVPVILNTSFNDMGEPIVETPADAIRTFLKGDIDLLCIGGVLGKKA